LQAGKKLVISLSAIPSLFASKDTVCTFHALCVSNIVFDLGGTAGAVSLFLQEAAEINRKLKVSIFSTAGFMGGFLILSIN
jgi:hypothetical protein